MVLNKGYKIHSGIKEKNGRELIEEYKEYARTIEKKDTEIIKNSLDPRYIAHRLFIIKGVYNFSDLNLIDNGWRITNTPTFEQEMILKNTPGYLDYKDTVLLKGLQGIATLDVNKKKEEHNLNIYLNTHSEENPDIFKGLISMFENGWTCKLENPEELKKETSNLTKKIGSN